MLSLDLQILRRIRQESVFSYICIALWISVMIITYTFSLVADVCQYVTAHMCKLNQQIPHGALVSNNGVRWKGNTRQGITGVIRRSGYLVWNFHDGNPLVVITNYGPLIQWSCELLLERFQGKETRPGKLGHSKLGHGKSGFSVLVSALLVNKLR
jgi:hypothetical protein